MKSERRSLLVITALGFYSFFLFGFTDNLKGPLVPALLADLGITYTQGSTILLMAYVGFMAAILAAGYISSRFSNRPVLLISGIMISLGAAGTAFGASTALLLGTFACIGFGLGCIEMGANGLIAAMFRNESGKYLNLLSVFHGAGSMTAPFLAGLLISSGTGWRIAYALIVPFALLQAVFFFIWRRPDPKETAENSREKISLRALLTRDLVLYSLFLTFYVCVEIGVASWMVDFLLKSKGIDVRTGSIMLSAYFGLLMVGRFIGSFIVERTGYRRLLIIAAVLATAMLTAGILLPRAFAFLLPCTGFFFSVMFPTATADAATRSPAPRSAVFGVLFFFASIGGMIGPWLTGVSADWFGIRGGFLMNVFYCLLMFISILCLKKDQPRPVLPEM